MTNQFLERGEQSTEDLLDETMQTVGENDDPVVEEPASQDVLREKMVEYGIIPQEQIEEILVTVKESGVTTAVALEKIEAVVNRHKRQAADTLADAATTVASLEAQHLLAEAQKTRGRPVSEVTAIKDSLVKARQRLARLQESNIAAEQQSDADTAAELLAVANRMRGKGVMPVR